MSETDLAGWGAAGLTLLTFVCKDMRQLRLLAICANGAFIGYGAMAGLVPVLVLHLALAPINLWRLLQQRRSERPPQPAGGRAAALRRSRTSGCSSPFHAARQPCRRWTRSSGSLLRPS